MARPALLEERLGHRFADPGLLEQALTHRSHGPAHNERLEFLGDGVLGCIVAQELYLRFPGVAEGSLTRLRASLVREEALADVAARMGLAELLRRSEVAASPDVTPSILADAMEAVVGAIFLDGGYDAARKAVQLAYGPLIEQLSPATPAKDAKTELQEALQSRRRALPEYRIVSVHGASHRQTFEVECRVPDAGLSTRGTGTSRQRAEQEAARAMLVKIAP